MNDTLQKMRNELGEAVRLIEEGADTDASYLVSQVIGMIDALKTSVILEIDQDWLADMAGEEPEYFTPERVDSVHTFIWEGTDEVESSLNMAVYQWYKGQQ